ncbi:hypothetical protein ACFL7D_04390 [candidate division KSB1 bacterium]
MKRPAMLAFACIMILSSTSYSQTVETIEGVRVIQNEITERKLTGNLQLEFLTTIESPDNLPLSDAITKPSDFDIDDSGNLYLLDRKNHRVLKYSPEGTYLSSIGGPGITEQSLYRPIEMNIDRNGNIYVTQYFNDVYDKTHTIKFNSDGVYLETFSIVLNDFQFNSRNERISTVHLMYQPDLGRTVLTDEEILRMPVRDLEILLEVQGGITVLTKTHPDTGSFADSSVFSEEEVRGMSVNEIRRLLETEGGISVIRSTPPDTGRLVLTDEEILRMPVRDLEKLLARLGGITSLIKTPRNGSDEAVLMIETNAVKNPHFGGFSVSRYRADISLLNIYDTDLNHSGQIIRPAIPVTDIRNSSLRRYYSDFKRHMNFTIDENDNVYVYDPLGGFLERYDPAGLLLFRSYLRDDILPDFPATESRTCRTAVDSKERIWILSAIRPETPEETDSPKTETDIFTLDVFDRDGIYLQSIPLTHYAYSLKISGDRLYLFDPERAVSVYVYKIEE